MPRNWKEDAIRHKYDPLPEEPRHRKKAKKRHVRSDHRHEYEEVAIDAGTHVGTYATYRHERVKSYHKGMRCRICGRLHDVRFWEWHEEPPEDMPLYKVDGINGLFAKELGEERRVR